MIQNYGVVALFIALASTICFIIYVLTFLIAKRKPNRFKNAPYECGFDQLSSTQEAFHVRYGLVAILFVLFDLEIMFLLPWALSIHSQSLYSFWIGLVFVLILSVGFYYEWKKGALDWY